MYVFVCVSRSYVSLFRSVFFFLSLCLAWMSRVTHIHVYECVMSQIWMGHATPMNESCHTHALVVSPYECGMSTIWMNHATHTNASCHTNKWIMSPMWMCHVTMTKVCFWSTFVSHTWMPDGTHIKRMSYVTRLNASCKSPVVHVMRHFDTSS